jgi:hypothetical protein
MVILPSIIPRIVFRRRVRCSTRRPLLSREVVLLAIPFLRPRAMRPCPVARAQEAVAPASAAASAGQGSAAGRLKEEEPKDVAAANNANAREWLSRLAGSWSVRHIAVRDASRLLVRCSVPGELRRPPLCKPACSMESCSLTGVRLGPCAAVPVLRSLTPLRTTLTALASAARSRPGKGMRSRLAWMSSPLRRPPLPAQPARHGEAVDQAARSRTRQNPRPRASIRVYSRSLAARNKHGSSPVATLMHQPPVPALLGLGPRFFFT